MKADNLTRAIANAQKYTRFADMSITIFGLANDARRHLEEAKANIRWAEEIIRTRARRAKKGARR